jgi:glycosyltransferase involved in cell wall biosynthesis
LHTLFGVLSSTHALQRSEHFMTLSAGREEEALGKPFLSIVVPLHNEEESVVPLYHGITNACAALERPYEIVFTDDGSRDRTFELLKQIHHQDIRVKVIRFRKNYGQTAAMAAGFDHARGDIIVSMDGDLQNDPTDIPLLLSKLNEGFDVVCGWRKDRQDKFWTRRVPSVIANWIIGLVTGVRIHDNGCSLKAYRASVIKRVPLYGEMHRFIPAMTTQADARIAEIVVNHHPRRFGASKYGIGRVWRVILDIFTVKMITGFGSRPGLGFGLLCLPFLVLGGLTLGAAGLAYLEHSTERWTILAILGLLWLFLSGHLLATAMIGELVLSKGDRVSPKESVQPEIGKPWINLSQ